MTTFDLTYSNLVLKTADAFELRDKLANEAFYFLLLDEKTNHHKLFKSDISILKKSALEMKLIKIKGSELEKYNNSKFEFAPTQEYLVVVIQDEHAHLDSFELLLGENDYVKQILTLISTIDKYCLQSGINKKLRMIVQIWMDTLIDENMEFWSTVTDTVGALFQLRRFRLELKANKENANNELLKQLNDAEAKQKLDQNEDEHNERDNEGNDEGDDNESTKFHYPRTDDYSKITEAQREYAESFDKKFAQLTPDKYNDIISSEHLSVLVRTLKETQNEDLLPRLWAIIATSPTLYQHTFNTEFNDPKIRSVQYMRHFMYLMYREECNTFHKDINRDCRHVLKLKQLTEFDMLTYPRVGEQFLPFNYTSFRGRNYKYRVKGLRAFEDYKNLLDRLTMDIFKGFKEPGFYVTGGLNSFCAIDCGNNVMESLKDNYIDSDLDVAIYAADEKEYDAKRALFEKHIGSVLGRMEKKDETKNADEKKGNESNADEKQKGNADEKSGSPKFINHANTKYHLVLPNNLKIEVFHIRTSPFSMITNFHVPPVRMFYDCALDESFILPSAYWAGLTGLCIDLKYFSSIHDPTSIIRKYADRGFTFCLNMVEYAAIEKWDDYYGYGGYHLQSSCCRKEELVDTSANIWRQVVTRDAKGNIVNVIPKIRPFNYPQVLHQKSSRWLEWNAVDYGVKKSKKNKLESGYIQFPTKEIPKCTDCKVNPPEPNSDMRIRGVKHVFKGICKTCRGIKVNNLLSTPALRGLPTPGVVQMFVGSPFPGKTTKKK